MNSSSLMLSEKSSYSILVFSSSLSILNNLESNLELIQDNVDSIKRYKIEDLELKENLQKRIEANEKLKAIINDIKYNNKSR